MITEGIHFDIPAAEYHVSHLCSNSACATIADENPAILEYRRANPRPPTPAMILGSALHALVLEPAKFDQCFVVSDGCGAVKKSGKRCTNPGKTLENGVWLCGTHAEKYDAEAIALPDGRIILIWEEYKAAVAMRDSVLAHPIVGPYLSKLEHGEVTAIWRDDAADILCKSRWDAPLFNLGVCLDLKKVARGGLAYFERNAVDRYYDTQAAFYTDAGAAVDSPFSEFGFVLVEDEPPFCARYLKASESFIEHGRRRVRPLIERYAECERTGIWPGYDDCELRLPPWRERAMEYQQELR